METLEELRNKYKKLQEESNNIYSKIRKLEKRNAISKFTVGECYLDTWNDNLIKIVSIQNNYVYYICLNNISISRENSCLFYIQGWKKITSKQFQIAYLAIMKDIQDPDCSCYLDTLSIYVVNNNDTTYVIKNHKRKD